SPPRKLPQTPRSSAIVGPAALPASFTAKDKAGTNAGLPPGLAAPQALGGQLGDLAHRVIHLYIERHLSELHVRSPPVPLDPVIDPLHVRVASLTAAPRRIAQRRGDEFLANPALVAAVARAQIQHLAGVRNPRVGAHGISILLQPLVEIALRLGVHLVAEHH